MRSRRLSAEWIGWILIGVPLGWAVAFQWEKLRRFKRMNLEQQAIIQKLTMKCENLVEENKAWKECRFRGGTPPRQPPFSVFSPTLWTADQVKRRALEVLGLNG